MTKNETKKYKDRLLKSFPTELKTDVESVVNILPLEKNEVKLCDGQFHKVENLIHPSEVMIKWSGEQLTIPYRLYFDEPDINAEPHLTDIQKIILNCIFLRHHNGYLRERRLKKLVDKDEKWIIPFTIQLLGEYVLEILQVLDQHINEKTITDYCSFIEENPKYWQQTESRMISYWNAYYKSKFPEMHEYLGSTLVKRIKNKCTTNP
ncbi:MULTISPECIES: hypothetical protein [unclassified Leeuwenhoekiella]|uniref:hypothetical protein n=1 Tax=unclassified Leeuwenhoekiella TaxID=2615029 RepID=UPI000C4A6FEB|nr:MULTISPECIES: hypothetical protein [unclassified Leeuwenhoekiella]MAW97058.1 hypothetical protein [Leeuwenhoekiella sp.]MBA80661.1 hypothetical protein [Leeuwenhoekiella sp.]